MRHLRKITRRKAPKVPSNFSTQNLAPSTSTVTSTEHTDVPLEALDWVILIANVLKDASEASPVLSPVKASCALLIRVLEIARSVKRNRFEWTSLAESMEQQKQAMDKIKAVVENWNENLRSSYMDYIKVIEEVYNEANDAARGSSPGLSRLLHDCIPGNVEEDSSLPLKKKLDVAYLSFRTALDATIIKEVINFAEDVAQLRSEVQEQVVESSGPTDDPEPPDDRDYDFTSRLLYGMDIPLCEEGTRTAVLSEIRRWAEDNAAPEKIFWLNDAAGTGKTTVAATLAHEWLVDHKLAGRFFFTPNSIAGSDVGQFCVTVAKDVAKLVSPLEARITEALKKFSRPENGFYQQFLHLLVEPLKTLDNGVSLVLVIDALDNCQADGRNLLLDSLLESITTIRSIKILLTSRPSPDIVDTLSSSNLVQGKDVQLFNARDNDRTDVKVYIDRKLPRLTAQQRESIVTYSNGLFIVAATACRLLEWHKRATEVLETLLQARSIDHLDALYLQVLKLALTDETAHEMMMRVLQVVVITFQPVSINTIQTFLSDNIEVGEFIKDLGAVLKDGTPDRPIRVLHPTFREFLAEEARANGFLINTPSSHAITALGCLNALDRDLEYDILRLGNAKAKMRRDLDVDEIGRRVSQKTSPATRYASSYWAYHAAASLDDAEVWRTAIDFISNRLLNWVELMSWRDSIGICIQGMSQLRSKALPILRDRRNPLKHDAIKVREAYQFLLQHQAIIQDSALQTYATALAFTPSGSPLFETYREKYAFAMPVVARTTPIRWPAHDVLSGHLKRITQVEFSPDGSRLATRADDSTLRIWDTTSGATLGYSFTSIEKIRHMSFSLDGERLAVATHPSKIHFLNAITGQRLPRTVQASSGEIVQLAFSPLQPIIISLSSHSATTQYRADNSLTLWSYLDGQQVGETMQLRGETRCFAVSPSGLRVACVHQHHHWREGVVTLWNLETYKPLVEYIMPEVYHIHCVSYSPAGNRFATWNQAGAIFLRDGINGDEIKCIGSHEGGVTQVCFSPQGTVMASYGARGSDICLWNSTNGVRNCILSGHDGDIRYVSFSQDGLRLASISMDQTLRVWNSTTGESMDTIFPGYTGNIGDPMLSTDWTKLVTTSVAYLINLYDSNAGTMRGQDIEGEDMDFATPVVAFSPNGEVMACGYWDLDDTSTLGLWNVETCTPVGVPMIGHKSGIISLAFSPDGTLVGTASNDSTIRIWNAFTGYPSGDPLAMRDVKYITFSPNGKFIASSSQEYDQHHVCIWDVQTRASTWSTKRKDSRGDHIAFSPDSSLLAGGAEGKLCLWDLASEVSSQPVARSVTGVEFRQLIFHPTGTIIATTSSHEIRLWKIADTLQMLAEISVPPGPGLQLGISSDGRFLAHGSSIWDILSPECPTAFSLLESDHALLDWDAFPQSLITYNDGWIVSPTGRLMPVPGELWFQFNLAWSANRSKIVVWTQNHRTPVVIDCAPLLAQFRGEL